MTQDEIKEFIRQLMTDANETEAWDEKEFDSCYKEFDYDGSGKITK